MKALIDVFRMDEISVETRISIIKQLGNAINHEYGMNLTEPIVEELVTALQTKVPCKISAEWDKDFDRWMSGWIEPQYRKSIIDYVDRNLVFGK